MHVLVFFKYTLFAFFRLQIVEEDVCLYGGWTGGGH